jgi:Ser/Thr protein kinase RdoA (MazF antagonist)
VADNEPIPVRVLYSLVDPAEIGRVVASQYDLGVPDHCRLLYAGHNDTYEVVIGAERYAFRLQSAKWWKQGESDARFELDLLAHLHEHDVPVAYPLPRNNGDPLGVIGAPEADRFYSLFSWAPGQTVDDNDLTPEQTFLVGRTMAAIHVMADSHQPLHSRYRLDEATLLDRSLAELKDELHDAAPDDVTTIERYVAEIRARLSEFDPGPTGWGIIHGDVYWANLHFDRHGQITVFDFDLCGYGWRGYDLAYYYTRIPEAVRAAALQGYQSVRPLSDAEENMLATFGRLAWIRADGRPVPRLAKLLRNPYV